MNLRGVYTTGDNVTDSLRPSWISGTQFANSIVGNLGGPLVFEERECRNSEGEGGERIGEGSRVPLEEYSPSGATLKEKQFAADNAHICDDKDSDISPVDI